MESSFLNTSKPLRLAAHAGILMFALLLFTGCSSSRKVVYEAPPPYVYYDFHDAALAIDAPIAPVPDIITNADTDVLSINKKDPLSIFRAAGAIAKESSATKARRRLREAGKEIDVSELVAKNILEGTQPMLGMNPVEHLQEADFILELCINRHGVHAGPSFDGHLGFFLNADVALFSPDTGERIWAQRIDIEEPLAYNSLFSNLHAARELSEMDEEEMIEALVRISEYSADAILRNLRRDIYRPYR